MKYKLTKTKMMNSVVKIYQIQALKDFGNIKAGDLGGWVESEQNLSQEDNCWIHNDAWVYGDARVSGNAQVYGNAQIYGDARVYGNARVSGDGWIR